MSKDDRYNELVARLSTTGLNHGELEELKAISAGNVRKAHAASNRAASKPPATPSQEAQIRQLSELVSYLSAELEARKVTASRQSAATAPAATTRPTGRHDAETQARLDSMTDRGREMAKSTKVDPHGVKQTFSHVGAKRK